MDRPFITWAGGGKWPAFIQRPSVDLLMLRSFCNSGFLIIRASSIYIARSGRGLLIIKLSSCWWPRGIAQILEAHLVASTLYRYQHAVYVVLGITLFSLMPMRLFVKLMWFLRARLLSLGGQWIVLLVLLVGSYWFLRFIIVDGRILVVCAYVNKPLAC